jgi:hypothetical protein
MRASYFWTSLAGLCFLLAVCLVHAQPAAQARADDPPAYYDVLESLGVRPAGTESPLCLRALSVPYVTLGRDIEAAEELQQARTAEAKQALEVVATAEQRAALAVAISNLIAAIDEVERLKSRYRASIPIILEAERKVDAAAADDCGAMFDSRTKLAGPYIRRLYALNIIRLQTILSVCDAEAKFSEAAVQFGSRERIPRTDPRYLGMWDVLTRQRILEQEWDSTQAAYASLMARE